jgi:hypothetical protein
VYLIFSFCWELEIFEIVAADLKICFKGNG